ncbi:hypothetical protein [Tenacibaculum maritimum]|uniref:hypothetical protein n=3 Tax=Tenacibaculum maritimum TaxID=107401 RepID=UPI0012E6654F|nr:hypothetical protein [Tenacibaculum maritimum]MDB0602722.1 hypothetical protein [Tenacibaculum maritimum]MDB0612324.1 hypothetical protein [Tenacibaculum maritimum]CAA0144319.1 hypothetical protein TM902_140065 [Tenacibaculum maritimum]CAA0194005.1 hypothetical protein TFA04_210067 [Tenacibaculum maritimum]
MIYNIYKKREGQEFKFIESIEAENYKEAKITFANRMFNEFHEGKHGDEYVEREGGIYDTSREEFIIEKEELQEGIEMLEEDVYMYEIKETSKYVEIDEEGEVIGVAHCISKEEATEALGSSNIIKVENE